MRYFGVLSSVILYFLLFGCVIWFSLHFLNNEQSIWLNLAGIVLVSCLFYPFALPYFKTRPGLVKGIFVVATLAIANFSLSFLSDLVNRTSEPPSLPKDDFSGVFTVPTSFLMVVIWGWIFDWRKNKIIKSQAVDE